MGAVILRFTGAPVVGYQNWKILLHTIAVVAARITSAWAQGLVRYLTSIARGNVVMNIKTPRVLNLPSPVQGRMIRKRRLEVQSCHLWFATGHTQPPSFRSW